MADIEQLKRALINADKAGDAEAARILAREIRAMQAQPEQERRHQQGNPYVESILQGATFGFSDEAQAVLQSVYDWLKGKVAGAPVGFRDAYAQNLAEVQSDYSKFRAEHPAIATTGEIAGGLATGSQAVKALEGAKALQALPQMARYAVGGAAAGATAGAGYAPPGERMEGAGLGAATGAVMGVAVPAAAGTVKKALAGRAARAATKQAQNAVRDATLAEAQAAGYTIPPSQAGAGIGSRLLEGLSGKYKTNQLAGIKNQQVTDSLIRKALKLPPDTPITPETLRAVRSEAFRVGYEPVTKAGVIRTDNGFTKALDDIASKYQGAARSFPGAVPDDVTNMVNAYRVNQFDAGDAVQAVQILRDQASKAYAGGDKALGKATRAVADAIEDQIERGLFRQGSGGKATLDAFREARKLMAKTHTVESALVEGSGSVDATKLAAALKKGKPLSDEIKTVAKVGQVFPDVARVPKAGDANPLTVVDYGVSGIGLGSGNPLMAVMPAARVASRYAITSPMYQRAFVHPSYGALSLSEEGKKQLVNYLLAGFATAGPAMVSRRNQTTSRR